MTSSRRGRLTREDRSSHAERLFRIVAQLCQEWLQHVDAYPCGSVFSALREEIRSKKHQGDAHSTGSISSILAYLIDPREAFFIASTEQIAW